MYVSKSKVYDFLLEWQYIKVDGFLETIWFNLQYTYIIPVTIHGLLVILHLRNFSSWDFILF